MNALTPPSWHSSRQLAGQQRSQTLSDGHCYSSALFDIGGKLQTIRATLTALVVGGVVGAFICGKQGHALKIALIGPGLLNVLFWGYQYFSTPADDGLGTRAWLWIFFVRYGFGVRDISGDVSSPLVHVSCMGLHLKGCQRVNDEF